jgi:drug/metabolite transporter (DMT)-like permease
MDLVQRGRMCVIGAAVCWSVVGAGVKLVSPPLDGWQVACGRSLFAFIFVCAMFRPWRAGRLFPGVKVLLLSCVYAAMLVLFILANTLTKSANAIFLQDSALVWVILFAPLVLKEPFRLRDLGMFVVCAAGLTLLFMDQLDLRQKEGNLLALLSGAAYATVLLSLRWGRSKAAAAPPPSPAAGQSPAAPPADAELMLVWGNLLCVLACVPFLRPVNVAEAGTQKVVIACATVAMMGLVQLGLGYYLVSKGMRHVPAVEAALLTLIEPVLNPIWAFIAVQEVPGPWALLGGAVIIASVAYQAVGERRRPAEKLPAQINADVRSES